MEFLKNLSSFVYLVPLFPLVGAFLNGLYAFSRSKPKYAGVPFDRHGHDHGHDAAHSAQSNAAHGSHDHHDSHAAHDSHGGHDSHDAHVDHGGGSRALVYAIALGALILSFIVVLGTFLHTLSLPVEERVRTITLFPWIHLGDMKVDVAFLIDPLSLTLMLVITGVGSLIHLYSIGYMSHEPGYTRYFAYLNLFCFAMLILVMGANIPMMFIGWEGVGLCSYLLIGFWFTDKEKATAGMKAFVVNRVGDFGFIIGFMLLYWTLQSTGNATVTFTELRDVVPQLADKMWLGAPIVTVICLFLFVGATGKSAQIPLYVWLPDAMAGPTPVSALIHAATMVTAGVYMIGRLSPLFSMAPDALNVIATVGFSTALFAALVGFTQNDIKKVLAYSTVSQLGYMFGAMGLAAYTAGVFHLVTHAFFKACLFLGSGSVIHAMSGEQDMRKMGALKKHLPITYLTFFLATLAIAGIFPFSGFFSKDEILWHAFNHCKLLWAIGVCAAAGTAIYMFRLVTMTFYGPSRVSPEAMKHLHESPFSMTFPLMVLALLSVAGGLIGIPQALGHFFHWEHSNLLEGWLEPSLVFPERAHEMASHTMEYALMIFSLAVATIGCFLGYALYRGEKRFPEWFVRKFPRVYHVVSNKFFVDEIYQSIIVQNLLRLNDFLASFDLGIVDGFVNLVGKLTKIGAYLSGWFDRTFVDGLVNLTATVTSKGGVAIRKMQSGRIQVYLYVAVAAILILMLYRLV